MDSDSIRDLLTTQPFFSGLEPHWLDRIAAIAHVERIDRGHFIMREGGDADAFYVILSGQVVIEMASGLPGPVTIENLRAGDILGWSVFLHPYKWSFSALAADDTEVLVFDGHTLRHLCHDHPDLGYPVMIRILDLMSHRLRAARMQLLNFYA